MSDGTQKANLPGLWLLADPLVDWPTRDEWDSFDPVPSAAVDDDGAAAWWESFDSFRERSASIDHFIARTIAGSDDPNVDVDAVIREQLELLKVFGWTPKNVGLAAIVGQLAEQRLAAGDRDAHFDRLKAARLDDLHPHVGQIAANEEALESVLACTLPEVLVGRRAASYRIPRDGRTIRQLLADKSRKVHSMHDLEELRLGQLTEVAHDERVGMGDAPRDPKIGELLRLARGWQCQYGPLSQGDVCVDNNIIDDVAEVDLAFVTNEVKLGGIQVLAQPRLWALNTSFWLESSMHWHEGPKTDSDGVTTTIGTLSETVNIGPGGYGPINLHFVRAEYGTNIEYTYWLESAHELQIDEGVIVLTTMCSDSNTYRAAAFKRLGKLADASAINGELISSVCGAWIDALKAMLSIERAIT